MLTGKEINAGRGGVRRCPAETTRLTFRYLENTDDAFILQLVNEPSWLRFIGDRGIHTLEEARNYIEQGPKAMYARHGFGLYLIALKHSREPIGLCGLIKRGTLLNVDLGFAVLESYQRRGYGYEAASATVEFATHVCRIARLVAIMSPRNDASATLVRKLGFRLEGSIRLEPDAAEVELYARDA